MVYSCIGAEIEDSDGSGTSDTGATADAEMSTAVSEAPAETCSNGHAAPSKQPMDTCRQERIVPLVDTRAEPEEGCGTKPSLAMMRQRHLQESLGNAGRSHLLWSTLQCVIDPKKWKIIFGCRRYEPSPFKLLEMYQTVIEQETAEKTSL